MKALVRRPWEMFKALGRVEGPDEKVVNEGAVSDRRGKEALK